MAQYNFEGDFGGINERQLEFINKVVVEQGWTASKVIFEQVGAAGDNYAASLKRIKITGENGSTDIIVKTAPPNENMRKSFNTAAMFRNEHIMYTELLPLLVGLQKEIDVPEEDQLRYPKCYGSLAEEPNEIILMEDLNTLDFIMLDRFKSLSDECIKSFLKNLSLLHSLCFVLRNKDPERYDYFKANLVNTRLLIGKLEDSKRFFQQVESNALMLLDSPKYKNAVKNKVTEFLAITEKLVKYEETSKYSVIQHGDAWTNNIMFRFEEGVLKESIMIDYQLSTNSSPVVDLLYMILNCTDHKTRSKYFFEWIDYYHTELDRSLSNFGLKASMVYPRDQLDADLRRYGKALFGFTVFIASILALKSKEASKMQDAMSSGNMGKMADTMNDYASSYDSETITNFRNRVVDLVDSCTQFGLL